MPPPSLPPLRIPFADLWGMRIEHPYSLLVREGGFAWTCGQCPLSVEGAVLAPDDLAGQAEPVDGYIRHLLAKAGYAPANVGKLVAYHAVDEPAATERMLSHFRAAYPGALLMPVATPFFYYPGMRLEVDVHAAERRAPLAAARDEGRGFRLQAVDAGDLVWVSLEVRAPPASTIPTPSITSCPGLSRASTFAPRDAQHRREGDSARRVRASSREPDAEKEHVDARDKPGHDDGRNRETESGTAAALNPRALADALRTAGVSADALLADHWFVGGDGAAPALDALQAAGLVTDPGAAVGVSLPGGIVAMGELTFAGGGGAASAPATPAHPGIALFARSSRRHFWIAARSLSPALGLVGETKAIMSAIAETMRARGWRFEAVTKATTHYVGSSAAEDLHDNMAVRNAYYRRPGPASTGLPVAAFPFSQSKIAVDVLGVVG